MLGNGKPIAAPRWPAGRVGRRRALGVLGLPLLALAGLRGLTPPVPAASAPLQTVGRVRAGHDLFVVTCSRGRHLAIVDPDVGVVDLIETGAAPHGLTLHPDGRAFVATAEGVAVVSLAQRQRLALLPYSVDVGPPRFGEYRPGGMGIAVTPDGSKVAVAVYRPGVPSTLDIVDANQLAVVSSVPVGVRPFQVVAAHDSRHVYSIDHDSYTVTVVDPDSGTARPLPAMPIGRGAFDKPHYAALRSDGALLLPYQGRALQTLDPSTGAESTTTLSANTHQHGIAFTPDERQLLIVGTGPAGGASGGPSLTIFDLATGAEEILPLARPHEQIAVSHDGSRAFLTGGYLLTGGWDGVTVVDLMTRATRELPVPDGPLEIALLP